MDPNQITAIAILTGVVGIVFSYYIGKAVGRNEQTEAVNDLQYQLVFLTT